MKRPFSELYGVSGIAAILSQYRAIWSGSRKRGVDFKGGSRHDRNRHDRQNRHGCLIVLCFVGQPQRRQGALRNRQNRRRVPGYSRSSSRNWKFHSRNTKFHSRNGLSRLDQYETHNSRSNSRSNPRNCREPTRKIFICPCILGAFFQELGWSPRTRPKYLFRLF